MKNAASTLKEATGMAEKMAKALKTPFSVIFDYGFDGMNDWRVALGKYPSKAAFVADRF